MAMLARALETRFIGSVVEELRTERPDLTAELSDEDLRLRASAGIELARRLGAGTDSATRTIIETTLAFGPRFDRHPFIARLLRGSSRPIDERVSALRFEVPDVVWEETAVLVGKDPWRP